MDLQTVMVGVAFLVVALALPATKKAAPDDNNWCHEQQ
jgi:hypothetical protein